MPASICIHAGDRDAASYDTHSNNCQQMVAAHSGEGSETSIMAAHPD